MEGRTKGRTTDIWIVERTWRTCPIGLLARHLRDSVRKKRRPLGAIWSCRRLTKFRSNGSLEVAREGD